jgi:hypothetical protein
MWILPANYITRFASASPKLPAKGLYCQCQKLASAIAGAGVSD